MMRCVLNFSDSNNRRIAARGNQVIAYSSALRGSVLLYRLGHCQILSARRGRGVAISQTMVEPVAKAVDQPAIRLRDADRVVRMFRVIASWGKWARRKI